MTNTPTIAELQELLRPQMEQAKWIVTDHESYHAALQVKRKLGSLPRRLSKTQVEFDPFEERTYGSIPGGKMAGLAARVVLTARDENRLMKTLRGIVTGLIAPFIAYLRVNLALTKLEETMIEAYNVDPVLDEMPKPVTTRKAKQTPKYQWRQSPQQAYGFKEAKAEYGFDPRNTSVYWIEKRAARLRQRWKRYANTSDDIAINACHPAPRATDIDVGVSNGERDGEYGSQPLEVPHPVVCPQTTWCGMTEYEDESVPIRDFVPADADYNTIWPPIELPKGPPKAGPNSSLAQRGRCPEWGERREVAEFATGVAPDCLSRDAASPALPKQSASTVIFSKREADTSPVNGGGIESVLAEENLQELGLSQTAASSYVETSVAAPANRKARRREAALIRRATSRAPPPK